MVEVINRNLAAMSKNCISEELIISVLNSSTDVTLVNTNLEKIIRKSVAVTSLRILNETYMNLHN